MSMRRVVVPTALSILAGCAFDPMFTPGSLRCTDNNGCPSGYQCVVAEGRTEGVCCSTPDAAECYARALGDAAAAETDAQLGPRADAGTGSGGSGGAGGAVAEDVRSGGGGAGGGMDDTGAGGTSVDDAPSSGGAASGGAGGAGGITGSGGVGTGGTGGTGGDTNLAENKPATASSNPEDAPKGNDGSLDTAFCPDSAAFPVWWIVDLGTHCRLSIVLISFEKPDSVYTYYVEYSSDGDSWSVLVDHRSSSRPAGPGMGTGVSQENVRYLRLWITGVSPAGPACFLEFKAWGIPTLKDGGM